MEQFNVLDNCDDIETREYMKRQFYNANTIEEFLYLWGLFYENKICLPTYYGLFYGGEYNDNPQANYLLGQKFKAITQKGLILTNSQVTIPYEQKAYIDAFVPKDVAIALVKELNRYNCIVAFFNYLKPLKELKKLTNYEGARGLYVTYDTYEKDKELAQEMKFSIGIPFSHAGLIDSNSWLLINQWINPRLKRIINNENYVNLTIIDANFNSDPEYLVDVLYDVVNYLQL